MRSAAYGGWLQAELLAQPVSSRTCCRTAETAVLMQLPAGEFTGPRLRILLGAQAGSPLLPARLGLLDHAGRRRPGLPPGMTARAGLCCATGICRGAVLAAGTLRPHGDRLRVLVGFPGVELAVAVAGAIRRLGTPAALRPTDDGGEQLRIPDGPALLQHLGATATLNAWNQRTSTAAPRGNPTVFARANADRTRTAATQANARITIALDRLGDNVPTDLAHAAQLRLQHPTASLTELAALNDPPISKDAIAGRLRRLLQLAEHHTTH